MSFIFFHLSLFKLEYTIILYQFVSYACGYLYSVMILLHIGHDGVVCYVIMKHANRVNTVFCIDFIPLMNVTYCFRVSLGCIRLTVCCYRIVYPVHDLC